MIKSRFTPSHQAAAGRVQSHHAEVADAKAQRAVELSQQETDFTSEGAPLPGLVAAAAPLQAAAPRRSAPAMPRFGKVMPPGRRGR